MSGENKQWFYKPQIRVRQATQKILIFFFFPFSFFKFSGCGCVNAWSDAIVLVLE